MKKEFTMRCNEEQFQSVLPALDQYGIDYSEVKFDNDRCFVYYNPITNTLESLISKVVLLSVSESKDLYDTFHYDTFIGRVSGEFEKWVDSINESVKTDPAMDFAKKWFQGIDPIDPKIKVVDHISLVQPENKELSELAKELSGMGYEYFEQTFKRSDNNEFHFSYFPKAESPISSGINISAGNISLAYTEFKNQFPDIEPFCIHDKSQL